MPSALLTPDGLPHDRRFILLKDHRATASDGPGERTPTLPEGNPARSKPHYNPRTGLENMAITYFYELALFTQEIDQKGRGRTFTVRYNSPSQSRRDGQNGVRQERMADAISIPLEPDLQSWTQDNPTESSAAAREIELILHSSPTRAYVMPQKYNGWFSEKLGFETVLAYLGPHRRKVLGNVLPESYNSARERFNGHGDIDRHATSVIRSWTPSLISGVSSLLNGGSNGTTSSAKEDKKPLTLTDIAPYLVVTEESLSEVSALLPEDVDMDVTKFRPNIVISGAEKAWDEDFWAGIQIDTVSSKVVPAESDGRGHNNAYAKQVAHFNGTAPGIDKAEILLTSNCARCKSLNVDFDTGQRAAGDSGKILAKLTKGRRVDKGWKYSPIFGRYGFLGHNGSEEARWIQVGSYVEVSKRNTERTHFGM